MSNLEILVGVSCSGKTTYAKTVENAYIVSRDVERETLLGVYRMGDEKEEQIVSNIVKEKVLSLLSYGKKVILDNTHLKLSYIQDAIDSYNYLTDISFKVFETPEKEELIKRNQERFLSSGKMIPEKVLYKQQKDFTELKEAFDFEPIEKCRATVPEISSDSLEGDCYIVDLDGTVALLDRSPFNPSEEEVSNDVPNVPVILVLQAILNKGGVEIVFLSGRSDKYEEVTKSWIVRCVFPANKIVHVSLHMRKEGDYRSDYIVKKEMYNKFIKPHFRVLGVFDDREKVLTLWRQLGLFTFDVGQGKNRF